MPLQSAMNYYVEIVSGTCHCNGMGSKVIKNHLRLHFPHYIKLWGPPSGWDSGPSESHHETEVKVLSKDTQCHQLSIICQTILEIL